MSSPQPMPVFRWEPGVVVDGYNIVRRLARGGMAELFVAAPEADPAREVVIKRVHAHLRSDPGFDAMFVRETRIAASLDHPNIVRVLNTGTVGDELYLVMEYLRGMDVRALLRQLSRQGQALPLGEAIRIVIGAARGLAYAHDQSGPDGQHLGIVHRDVSPSNLFVTDDGQVKLVDFGIAKTTNATQITGVGVRKGKGAYMAPEQCMAGVVDRRSDVFALGAVLYELTTMTRAFNGENELAVLHAITTRQVESPSSRVPDYPPALEAVVLAAMHREPDRRWADAGEMATALEELALRPSFQCPPAALAQRIRSLTARPTAPSDLASSAVDLTPPPFGVSDRSDGSLLLPTPTNMEGIIEGAIQDDSAWVLADLAKPIIQTPAQPVRETASRHTVVTPEPHVGAAGRAVPGVVPFSASPVAPVDVEDFDAPPTGSGRAMAIALVALLGVGGAYWAWSSQNHDPEPSNPTPAASLRDASVQPPQSPTPTDPTPASDPAPNPEADLVRLNDPVFAGAMTFAQRHALLRSVTAANLIDRLNVPLHQYLDVAQAEQSTTPCATFRGALGSLATSADATMLQRARQDARVPTEPGPNEDANACEGLDTLLTGTNQSTGGVASVPKSASKPPRTKPSRTPKTNGATAKPAIDPPPTPVPETTPKPEKPKKPEVGGKLNEDLRPFGSR